MSKTWCRALGLTAFGLLAVAAIGRAGNEGPGPINSLQDLQDTGRMIFKIADENNDGQISQKEAVDAGNLVVGGFFFRADTNGDGVLSKEEARQAKDQLLAQNPILRVIVEKNQNVPTASGGTPATNATQGLMSLLDANNDGQLQASEVRQMVQTTVTAIFASADTNRDGQLSPTEVNAALIGMAKAAALAAFQAADLDKNGQISQAEFDKALIEPAHALFRSVDANNDGQISQQEAQTAERAVIGQVRMLRVPEPANSARNLLRTGQAPEQIAPTPRFNSPAPAPATPQP